MTIVVLYLYIKILYSITINSAEVTRTTDYSKAEMSKTEMSKTAPSTTNKSQLQTPEVEMQSRESVASNTATDPPQMQTLSPSQSADGYQDTNTKPKVSISIIRVTLQETQMKLVRNVTKNTLLGLIGLVSTIMLNVKTSYEWIIDAKPDPSLWRSLASFDGAINIITMYLIFGWTAWQYNKSCKYCHNGMENLCVWCTKRSILRQDMKEHGEDY